MSDTMAHLTEVTQQYIDTIRQHTADGTAYSRIHPQDLETIKQLVQREVQRALHPQPGLIDVKRFLRVEITDQDGQRWKGLLYQIEEGP